MHTTQHLTRAPWPVLVQSTVDSTNLEALRRAEAGSDSPCWIRAETQTAGRGRLGRVWSSAAGNLFASALFPLSSDLAKAPLICFAAGLAVTDAIAKVRPEIAEEVRLKWPNDVLATGAKICGILIETTKSRTGTTMVVAGFGVNLSSAPDVEGRETASVSGLLQGLPPDPETFLTTLDETFRWRLRTLMDEGFEPIRRDWIGQTVHIGGRVTYTLDRRRTEGQFVDLGPDGALVVRESDGQIRYVRTGEVGLLG